jgi:hypothetical protein
MVIPIPVVMVIPIPIPALYPLLYPYPPEFVASLYSTRAGAWGHGKDLRP